MSSRRRPLRFGHVGRYRPHLGKNLPEVLHVFDLFHVLKLNNHKLSDFRHDLIDARERQILKGVCWLLLKNPENLDEGRIQVERPADALELNGPLKLVDCTRVEFCQDGREFSNGMAACVRNDWIATRHSDSTSF